MKVGPYDAQVMLSEETLAERCKQLGEQIRKDFGSEEICVVGVLKGSVVFLTDLMRNIDGDMKLEFIGVKSYEGTQSTGHVQITTDLSADIKGKSVLVVEDIVDTGTTLDFLIHTLKVREPAMLKTCTLLSKPEAHIMKNNIDYVGFEISTEFVVGYGLDLDGLYRNLPYIAQITSEN